jgi:hypothetical protein
VGETSNAEASVRTDGSGSPGAKAPEATPRSTDAAISLAVAPLNWYCGDTDYKLYQNR